MRGKVAPLTSLLTNYTPLSTYFWAVYKIFRENEPQYIFLWWQTDDSLTSMLCRRRKLTGGEWEWLDEMEPRTCSESRSLSVHKRRGHTPSRVFTIPVLIPFRFHFGSGSRIFESSILYDSICLAIADHPLLKFLPWLHSLHSTVKYSALMYEKSKISTLWALISVIQIIFEFLVPNDYICYRIMNLAFGSG